MNRIIEVIDFSKKYRYIDILLKNINFIHNRLVGEPEIQKLEKSGRKVAEF